LSPTQFEDAVADLLAGLGYQQVRRVGGSSDLGIDVECRDDEGSHVVVQCKRYAPNVRVGSQVVQQFIGMALLHHKADHAIFITTSVFTKPAVALADAHNIELIDGPALERLLACLDSVG
jgi:restriction system protein